MPPSSYLASSKVLLDFFVFSNRYNLLAMALHDGAGSLNLLTNQLS